MTINSKQRVRAVFEGQMPDRPPLGFFAIDSDTAGRLLGHETYWRAKAKCQIAFWEGRRDEVVQSWIEDGIALYKKLNLVDIVPIGCEAAGLAPPKDYEPLRPKRVDETTWEDRAGRIYKYSPQTQDITLVHDPQRWTRSYRPAEELWNGTVESVDDSVFEVVDALIAAFRNDRFILGPSGEECAWLLLGGMERGLLEIADHPQEMKQIFASRVAKANAEDESYIRPGQDGVLWGQDLASQQGPLINPQTYRELFLEGFCQRVRNVKQKNQFVVKHACGNNWPLLDMFVEAGIDAYQSIQESAGMNLVEVQKRYGGKFTLWGGVRVEHLLTGNPEDICHDVDRFMCEIAPHGRCILGTSHSVAVGTRYENFMALLDRYNKII